LKKEKDDDGGKQMEEKVRASERATSNYSSPAESAKKKCRVDEVYTSFIIG